MDYIVQADYIASETGEYREVLEYCKDLEHVDYFIIDLLKSFATDIHYTVFDSDMNNIDYKY